MHFLLTNDDGIDAPGLAALQAAIANLGQVTVVAPSRGYSGCGHQVTYRETLQVDELSDRRYQVHGTPADCVRVGLTAIARDTDVVLSGINEGGNMGVDVYMSGTVAAVREAVWLGTPGIAFSQYFRAERQRDWAKATAMAIQTFELLKGRLDRESYWNANFPDVDTPLEELQVTETFVEPNHMPIAFERKDATTFALVSDYRNRARSAGSDVEQTMGKGAISISRVVARP